MSFDNKDLTSLFQGLPSTAFGTDDGETRLTWAQFVCETDSEPKKKHGALHYISLARLLAEQMGSAQPEDYQECGGFRPLGYG